MEEFNPDKYLAKSGSFDPDAYLNKSAQLPEFDPFKSSKALARGAAQGVSLGFADELTGGIEALWEKAAGNPEEFGKLYKQFRDESRANYEQAEKQSPEATMAGQATGAIGSLFVPGLNIGTGAKGVAAARNAAVASGLTGLGTSEQEDLLGLLKDTGMGVAIGTGFQVAPGAIAAGVKKYGPSGEKVAGLLSKMSSFFSGVDEEAALRQIQRPAQTLAAETDDFVFNTAKKAVAEAENLGEILGAQSGKAGKEFLKNSSDIPFEKTGKELVTDIDDFLIENAPSPQGFSALRPEEVVELQKLKGRLDKSTATGADLYKLRGHIDHVEGVAKKYDKDGTGPFVNFLKRVRHKADNAVDAFDSQLDNANKALSQYKDDTSMLRGAVNDAQAESMISNLYGTNKKMKQEAASRLFSPDTLESAKDVASFKAFEAAKKPGGDNYFRRAALGTLTLGGSELLTNPNIAKKTLRTVGRLQGKLSEAPTPGKMMSLLQKAHEKGGVSRAATQIIMQEEANNMMEKMTNPFME